MKGSRGHPGGADSPSEGKKDAIPHQETTPRNETANAKPLEPPVAAGPSAQARRVLDRRRPSRRLSLFRGLATTTRASATSGKTSQSRTNVKNILLSSDVRAFMKQLAEQEKKDEGSRAGALHRVASPRRQDPFGKLLERHNAMQAQVVDGDPALTASPTGGHRRLFVVLEQLTLHKRLLAAVCVAFVSLVLVTALTVLVVSGQQAPRTAASMPLLAAVLPVCSSKGCRSAMEMINLSVDTSADPCQDAYALACGRWRFEDERGRRLTYKRMAYDNYVWQAHMLLVANGSHPRPELYVPSRIYRSCVNFLAEDRARLVELWESAGMKPDVWLAVRNFSELFSLILNTMISNRLESVFQIERNPHPVVTTGRSMKTDALNPAYATKQLLKEVNRVLLRPTGSEALLHEVATLDDAVDNVTEAFAKKEPVTVVNSSALDDAALGVRWAPWLTRFPLRGAVSEPNDGAGLCFPQPAAPQHAVPENASSEGDAVKVNDVRALRLLLSLMGAARLKVAAVHALLVPVAEFMSIEYNVSSRRGAMPYGHRWRTCLVNMHRLLLKPFAWALARAMQGNETAQAALEMWKDVRHVGATMRTIAEGLQLSDMTLMHDDVTAEGDNSDLPTKPFSREYGDGFVSNLVIHVRLTGRRLPAHVAITGKRQKPRLVPAVYMMPDFFYPSAPETGINYGTLGAHMAKMMFNCSAPHARLPKYRDCFVRFGRQLGLDLSGNELGRSLRTRWAAEVALQAWKNDQPGSALFLPLTKLFFLRFAMVYCGNRPSRRHSLLFATRTSATYAEAFNCTSPPPIPC
ncbi:uncharacterized protein [Dermacentor albipictus]|uniref:uncharacterized protein n=1 Tax=Dermacentor albipictus TaxID=60249 RepID=UPI0031FD85B0